MRIDKSGNRGFTLVELCIVVAIFAILTAISIPAYSVYTVQSRLKGAARQVMSDLMDARMMAVNQNKQIKVHFETDNHTYKIWSDADGNGTVDDNEGINISRNIQNEYVDVTFGSKSDLIFNPRGAATQFGTIEVTNAQGSKYIIVGITGRVRISDTTGT